MTNKKSRSWHPTLTMHQKSATVCRVCLEKQSSTQIKTEKNLPCTNRTVRNVLQNNFYVKYSKLRPPLKKLRKKHRLEFSKKRVSFRSRRKNVVFSDEKNN